MTKIQSILLLVFVALFTKASAQEHSFFIKGEKSPNVHHVGTTYLKEISSADSIFNSSIAYVMMEAGARLDWHKHPGGQILMITEGEGYYQERNKPKQTVRKGEVVKCQPDVEHWHGATPESAVSYMASSPAHKGKTIWLQKLTEEEYLGVKTATATKIVDREQELLQLSKDKWTWMAERKVDTLSRLFHEKAMFVHMGGNMNKTQELDVIKTGRIHYKHTEIQEASVRFIDNTNTAIVLNKIKLTAVVGGNEVVNPFTVTEIYIREGDKWVLGTLAFSKLLTPP